MCCIARLSEKLRNYPKNHEGAAFYTVEQAITDVRRPFNQKRFLIGL